MLLALDYLRQWRWLEINFTGLQVATFSIAISIKVDHFYFANNRPGAGFIKNLRWFIREQRKLFLFNEAVFVFMISFALILNQLLPMLWIFALSQLYYGSLRAWQRGRQIYLDQHSELLKPMEK